MLTHDGVFYLAKDKLQSHDALNRTFAPFIFG